MSLLSVPGDEALIPAERVGEMLASIVSGLEDLGDRFARSEAAAAQASLWLAEVRADEQRLADRRDAVAALAESGRRQLELAVHAAHDEAAARLAEARAEAASVLAHAHPGESQAPALTLPRTVTLGGAPSAIPDPSEEALERALPTAIPGRTGAGDFWREHDTARVEHQWHSEPLILTALLVVSILMFVVLRAMHLA